VDVPPAAQLAERLRAQPRTARLVEAFATVPGAHLVGGAVRDLLRGEEPVDLDVVVEGVGALAAREAASRLGGEVRRHERFGTATVVAGDLVFDVVTARSETYPSPGALPEVGPGTLDEDLARRDFTVNAIALALHADALGSLHAYPAALDDLDTGTLRVMHAASFLDDPTRLLRLVRYAARLDFEPDPRTDALARDAIAAGAPATVSGARIGAELRALAGEPAALAALTRAHALGLDRALHPSFDPRLDLLRDARAHLGDGRADLVVLAACCTRFERGELVAWLDALELVAAERDAIVAAALDAETLAERLTHAHRASEVRHLAAERPVEELAMAAALGAAEPVDRWLGELRHVRLEITGDDVLAAGVPEGPLVGRGLQAAWAARLDDGAADREAQLAAALRAVQAQ
jgi:tRNA nucleotidyltransferase (CCA-adding enzyme)